MVMYCDADPRMGFLSIFRRRATLTSEDTKHRLCNDYLKTLVRYKAKLGDLEKISSDAVYLKLPYINECILEILCDSSVLESKENEDFEIELYEAVLDHRLNYDDFITLFDRYFDYGFSREGSGGIQEFVRPFYRQGKRKPAIMKLIIYLFLFHIYYCQFYMLMTEFLEVSKGDMEYYLYLFLHNVEKEKISMRKRDFHYELFDTYIKKLYSLYYLSIHYIQDVTEVTFPFDIHSTHDLKRNFTQRIVRIPSNPG